MCGVAGLGVQSGDVTRELNELRSPTPLVLDVTTTRRNGVVATSAIVVETRCRLTWRENDVTVRHQNLEKRGAPMVRVALGDGPRQAAPRSVTGLLAALIISTMVVVVSAPTAGAVTTPLPTLVVAVPTTATSVPFGSNDPDVANLSDFGYVQEEFFISGATTAGPYTTRMLVRRPADPKNFSGTVIAESLRSTAIRSMWSLRDYMMRSGDAYVEIGSNVNGMAIVKSSNPTRYGPISMPTSLNPPSPVQGVFGHVQEIIAQGGELLKANPAGGPLDGFEVRNVILAGCSEQGLIIRQYMRDTHPVFREADGSSVYDGYFPACVADWPSQFIIVNGVPFANFTPGPIEVPVVNLAAQVEVDNYPQAGRLYRRPDADSATDKYRVYEVAGSGHGLSQSSAVCAAGQQPSQFKEQYVADNALDKLVQWVDQGIAPPHGTAITTTAPNGPIVTDAFGNALGGIRSWQVDVPTATYHTVFNAGNIPPFNQQLCTWQVPFSTPTLQSLYKNQGQYISAANGDIHQLEREGWVLHDDTKAATDDAKAVAATLP